MTIVGAAFLRSCGTSLRNIASQQRVSECMKPNATRISAPEWLILIGASAFIIVLAVSAFGRPTFAGCTSFKR